MRDKKRKSSCTASTPRDGKLPSQQGVKSQLPQQTCCRNLKSEPTANAASLHTEAGARPQCPRAPPHVRGAGAHPQSGLLGKTIEMLACPRISCSLWRAGRPQPHPDASPWPCEMLDHLLLYSRGGYLSEVAKIPKHTQHLCYAS